MRLLVIGNCQQTPLWSILNGSGVDIQRAVKPIHQITPAEAEGLRETASGVDGVIMQSNTAKKYKEMGLDTVSVKGVNRNVCVIPNIHCGIYHPTFISASDFVSNNDSPLIALINKCGFGLHFDCLQLAAYDFGVNGFCLTRLLSQDVSINSDFVDEALSMLSYRESGCDVTISDWISNNYKADYLFYTFNHPANVVILELCKRILRYFNIEAEVNCRLTPYLSNYRFPIYKFIMKSLGFDRPPSFPFGGGENDHKMLIKVDQYSHIDPSYDVILHLVLNNPTLLDSLRLKPQYKRAQNVIAELTAMAGG
jgi:hypothetical protein